MHDGAKNASNLLMHMRFRISGSRPTSRRTIHNLRSAEDDLAGLTAILSPKVEKRTLVAHVAATKGRFYWWISEWELTGIQYLLLP